MKLSKLSLIGLVVFGLSSAVYATDSTNQQLEKEQHTVMDEQPTTTTTQAPVVIYANNGGQLTCPAGYVLTQVNEHAQSTTNVEVDHECNGVAIVGYAHVWCHDSPTNYPVVNAAPDVAYTCQKVVNQWVPKA